VTAKFTVSVPDELLERLDAEAELLGTSRSQLVQESVATYLTKTLDERAAEARRVRILSAIERMRHFDEGRTVHDDRPSLEILHEIRETDDGGPLR
jgi:metal-responsive CopG/Arc/MetJ family transcriptional regulator